MFYFAQQLKTASGIASGFEFQVFVTFSFPHAAHSNNFVNVSIHRKQVLMKSHVLVYFIMGLRNKVCLLDGGDSREMLTQWRGAENCSVFHLDCFVTQFLVWR